MVSIIDYWRIDLFFLEDNFCYVNISLFGVCLFWLVCDYVLGMSKFNF